MELRPYQKEDVQQCLNRDAVGIFNEQRTGKTPTVCTVLKLRGIITPIIVCPASLVYVWKCEYEIWTGNPVQVIGSTKWTVKEWDKASALIVNYEKIRGTKTKPSPLLHQLELAHAQAVVVDEAHRMKDRKSLTSAALRKLRKAPVRIAITGTPSCNKPWDVWAILNWLFPDVFKSFWQFIDEYFTQECTFIYGQPHYAPVDYKHGAKELLAANLNTYCIQRKRKDVMQWAEIDSEVTKVYLPCSPTQEKAIAALEKYFEYKHIITQTLLDNLVRIRQICAAPEILDVRGKSPKMEWLQQYISDYPEKSIIVFSNSTKFLKLICKKFTTLKLNHALICGETKATDRAKYISQFQNKQIPVILIQVQAGKEGLTLDQADTTIFLDTYPPAADYAQAKDRMIATTPDKVKPKEIIHVMMKDTYDQQLFELVEQNISSTEVINDYKKYLERKCTNG